MASDKNQDNQKEATKKFQEISVAYEILSNKEKRQLYDQIGMDILQNNGEGSGIDPREVFVILWRRWISFWRRVSFWK